MKCTKFYPAVHRLVAVAVFSAGTVFAGEYAIDWYTVDGGGAGPSDASSGGSYVLSGSIGQPDAQDQNMQGGSYTLMGGFWAVAAPVCTTFVASDFNQDCSVDGSDLAVFIGCVTGPAVPYAPTDPPPGCTLAPDDDGRIAADLDEDSDVDQSDFGVFQRCWSGPGIPANPACDP